MSLALKPSQAVNKAYLNDAVIESEINRFRTALSDLLDNINIAESEEHNKTFVEIFLRDAFYKEGYVVNTKQKTDAAIYEKYSDGRLIPIVLIEAKGPGRPDMVKKTDLNQKALHELILYYLHEEVRDGNTEIKHLIITDCFQWFVFEKKLFYQLFAKNKSFAKRVLEADKTDNTEYIYKQIIKPVVEQVKERLQYTYFDLRDFQTQINDEAIIEKRKFITLYKFLSPIHLVRVPYAFDHNKLNKSFYKELLYIMGVEEMKDKNTGKIEIKRLRKNKQEYSLLEQVIAKLEDYDIGSDNEVFDVALGLVLTWINRILFLKLLEAQLISFNVANTKKFLCTKRVSDYDVLHDLFMKVLAKPIEERSDIIKQQFSDVPYLNSSLFELSIFEKQYFPISGIRMGGMQLLSSTVLKNEKGKKRSGQIQTLEYLFSFLDAYDFGTNSHNDSSPIRTESKTIINAAVLGLIFEKINGYKDGSFFTPGFITEYICRKTLRRAVVDKFNEIKKWNCQDFEELKERIDYGKRDVRIEANSVINDLKVCDPAVGSGHFLVSALNEFIAIKSELGILQDNSAEPKRIVDYDITIEDDELVMANEDGEQFSYDPNSSSSQRIQQILFEEKRIIIENCLFGVDLNPKSVEICRLRLWIELLKNAYFYRSETGKRVLQTLPNIDINIKCGNSLFSNHPVCVGKKINNIEGSYALIQNYKKFVKEYKQCKSKGLKQRVRESILRIKKELFPYVQYELFEDNSKKDTQEIQDIKKQALEWMIEFPEILSNKGEFEGFDVIIGNPPYISLEDKSIKNASKVYGQMKRLDEKNQQVKLYETFQLKGDIYTLFIERGLQLLKSKGHLSYIIPNKWLKVGYGKPLRKLFLKENLTYLIDFGNNQMFDDATTYTCIVRMIKEASNGLIYSSSIAKVNPRSLAIDVDENKETFSTSRLTDGIWHTSLLCSFEHLERINNIMSCLGDVVLDNFHYGIKVGCTDAFKLTKGKSQELIEQDYSAIEILRPFLQGAGLVAFGQTDTNSFLLFIPKGFTIKGMKIDLKQQPKPSDNDAWNWFSGKYPSVAKWLLQYKSDAEKRSDKGDYWWELRACSYYDKFNESKIFYQTFPVKPCFVYSEQSVFCNNSMWFLSVDNKALFALLNSDVCWWLISEYCPRIQNGYQLIWDNFKQIPIPKILPPRLAELADEIMEAAAKKDDANKQILMDELNNIACELYGITREDLSKMVK